MRKYIFTLYILGLFFPFLGLAQEKSDSSKVEMDSIKSRLQTLEKFNKKISSIIPYLPNVSGYVGIGYAYDDATSNFDVKYARIDLKGKLPAHFGYRLLIDLYKFKAFDVCIKYNPFNAINFNIGQFKVPFSIGNVNGPLQEECIDFPLVIRKVVYNGIYGESTSGRDVGISMYGGFFNHEKYNILDYNIGVFNGNGMNLSDNNKSKDLSMKLELHPIYGLSISGSYYWGEYGKDYAEIHKWSAGAGYKDKLCFLRGEYVCNNMSDVKSDGYYVIAGVNLPFKLTPIFRYDTFTKDKSIGDTEHDYTVGVSYLPFKFLRIQANYIRSNYAQICEKSNSNQYKMVITGIL